MRREKVIELARKAGFKVESFTGGENVGKESVFDFGDVDILPNLMTFASLVAEDSFSVQKPLSQEDIEMAHLSISGPCPLYVTRRIIRWTERAHGITEEKQG